MDISLKLANSYFGMLKSLSNETKLHLIKMLTDSMLHKDEKKSSIKNQKFEDLFGIWSDDSEADNMIEAIRVNKCSGKTRRLIPLDE